MGVRLTIETARVLRALLEEGSEPRYGFDLMRRTELASGTLYPILARLERAGWVGCRTETINPAAMGRPPRKFYTLTATGHRAARAELAKLSAEMAPPAS